MAEKNKATKADNVAKANASTSKASANENIKLTKEEQTALDVQSKISAGEQFEGKFKLKDPNTTYSEPDFTLAADQEKELPQNPSPELLARIRSGFIVQA